MKHLGALAHTHCHTDTQACLWLTQDLFVYQLAALHYKQDAGQR